MNQALNIDDLERRIGVHDGLNIDEAMKLVARLRDLERELSIAKGNNAARIDGLQAAISVLEKRAPPAGEAERDAMRWRIFAEALEGEAGKADLDHLVSILDQCAAKAAVGMDAISHLLAALPAAANQAGMWQPIETAPKGCEIWAFNGEQARMQWSEGDADNGEGWALWVWADQLLSDADPEPDEPTHWMALPAAPHTEPQKE